MAYRLEDQVGYLLRKAHQRATAIFQATMPDPITPTQFTAMVRLSEEGELSQNRLGRLTAMDPATIQGVIRRLVEQDLVETRADPVDRRRRLLRLSDAGKEHIESLIPHGPAVSDRTLEPLSPAERRTFLALLQRLT